VPQELIALTFDLLLAYRGALAMRAEAHTETQPRRSPRSGPRAALSGMAPAQLEGQLEGQRELSAESPEDDAPAGSDSLRRAGPLSPATVNIRLTALRQFLVYCALYGSTITLTPDQIRAALRRLSIERRRPYQTLAEPEWAQFLAVARLPAERVSQPVPATTEAQDDRDLTRSQGPWGIPRAVRQEAQAGEHTRAEAFDKDDSAAEQASLIRSKAGLTGKRTALRDHALLALALATGLRAIELASLDVGDLSREWRAGQVEWWLVLPDSKTKGQHGGRTLPLAPELVEVLRDYVEASGRHWESPEDHETPLFLSGPLRNPPLVQSPAARRRVSGASEPQPKQAFRRLSLGQIRLIVDRVEAQWHALYEGEGGKRGRRSGATRRISPHALRHSTAIALLEGNQASGRPPASVEHVRGWLGHLDIRTTQGYLAHLDARRHRRPYTLSPGARAPVDGSAGSSPDAGASDASE
jgi:integrase